MADAVARPGTSGGASSSGPGWPTRLKDFYHGVMAEMRKVTWPTRRMVITESVVVVVFVIFFTCLIVGLDRVFALVFNALLFGK